MAEEFSNGNVMKEQIRAMGEQLKDLKTQIDSNEKRIVDLEKMNARLEERLTLFSLAQTVFTTIAGVGAAILGRLP